MGLVAEGVEEEDVEIVEHGEGGLGNLAVIGEVGEAADAVAVDVLAAVEERDGLDVESEEFEGAAVVVVGFDFGDVGGAGDGIEHIRKDAAEGVEGVGGSVDGDAGALEDVEGADVVEAEDVIGVGVGEEDGVDAADVVAEDLGAEVGGGVDEDVAAFVLDQDGRAEAVVVRIGGVADGAGAADGGDAGAGAGAQDE